MANNFLIHYTDDSVICENVPESLQTPEFINSQGKYISDAKIEKYKTIGLIAGGLITLGTSLLATLYNSTLTSLKSLEDIEKMNSRDKINYLSALSKEQLEKLTIRDGASKIIQIFFDSILEGKYSDKEKEILKEQTKILCEFLKVDFPE